MSKRRFSPEKKHEIVLEALKNEEKRPQLPTKHGIRLDMLEDWKRRFFEMGIEGLRYGKTTKEKAFEACGEGFLDDLYENYDHGKSGYPNYRRPKKMG